MYCTRYESVVPPYVQIEFLWFQGWLFWLGPTTGAELYCDCVVLYEQTRCCRSTGEGAPTAQPAATVDGDSTSQCSTGW